MRDLQKSKRVTWASDLDLCQVKLFLSEESPSLIELGGQDHLQAKALGPQYSSGAGHDDNLPPGFEGNHSANVLRKKLSQIHIIKWQCPARFAYDPTWMVVAGDESNEAECQNDREMRVLEAIYPRTSSIPPNPLLMGVEGSSDTDHQPPLIPIMPIEDDDTAADTSLPPNTSPMNSHPQQSLSQTPSSHSNSTSSMNPPAISIPPAVTALGVEPDIIKAAYNALSAVMANSDQATRIDPDLLISILKDPNLLEKIGTSHGTCSSPQNIPKPSTSPQNLPTPVTSPHNLPTPVTGPQNLPMPRLQGNTLPDSQLVHISRTEAVASSLAATPSRPFHPPLCIPGPIPNFRLPPPEVVSVPPPRPPPLRGVPGAKDLNYYKNLIQQHGEERQEPMPQFENHFHQLRPNQEPANNLNFRQKIMKPCIYFNSSRGCRYGVNCAYQHDVSSQQVVNSMPDVQSAKRTKMDRERTGT